MTTALVRIRDCASRRNPPFISPETALHVYSLAREYGLHKESLEAAEETLKSPMTIQDLEDKLGIVPSVALYELWQYRQQVLVDLRGSLKSIESEVYQIFSGAYLDCVQTPTRSVLRVRGSKSRVLSHSPLSFYITTWRLITLRTDWGQLHRRFPGRDTRGSFVTIRGFFNRRRVLPFWEQRNKFIVRSKSVCMRATVY